MEGRERGITVLLFPWLGHGHISPFLELGKRLARKGFSIYLCSTPINLTSVNKGIENNPSIKTVELHLPNLPDLPPHYHTTNGLPPNLMSTIKKAFDMAAPNFSKILQTLKPDLLIHDFLQNWAPQIAWSKFNIPSVLFLTTGVVTSSYLIHKHINPDSPFPFPEIFVKDYGRVEWEHARKVNYYGIKDLDRVVSCAKQSCEVVLIKSFREIEGKYNKFLSVLCEKRIVPVGPLVSESVDDEEDNYLEIFEWLNKKEKASTVFVSFGSECFFPNEEMEEIACGLELSGVNFIWVIRFPTGEKVMGRLIEEFRERVGEKGMIVEKWAPQARILRHSSIGGFVSHCGWSSVMEAMTFGIPIIAMPIQLDQPLNARVVQEAGVGEEVERRRSGELQGGEIARVIRKIVVNKEGEEVRRKAKCLRERLKDKGDQDSEVVMKQLIKLCSI